MCIVLSGIFRANLTLQLVRQVKIKVEYRNERWLDDKKQTFASGFMVFIDIKWKEKIPLCFLRKKVE